MNVQETRTIVARAMELMAQSQFLDMLEMMSDDAIWWIAGTTILSGAFSKEDIRKDMSRMGDIGSAEEPMTMTMTSMIAEGNRAVVECQGRWALKTGERYDNSYVLIFEVAGGKITSLKEYMDTELVTRVLGKYGSPM